MSAAPTLAPFVTAGDALASALEAQIAEKKTTCDPRVCGRCGVSYIPPRPDVARCRPCILEVALAYGRRKRAGLPPPEKVPPTREQLLTGRTTFGRPNVAERLAAKSIQDPETGCIVWHGRTNREGYGRLFVWTRSEATHRLAYEIAKGPIPDGLVLDHLCRNTSCCNPEHLEPVTVRENILRGESPSACLARQTHCKRGHELSGDNLWTDGRSRQCITCRRDRERARRVRAQNAKRAFIADLRSPADPEVDELLGLIDRALGGGR